MPESITRADEVLLGVVGSPVLFHRERGCRPLLREQATNSPALA
ncbi:hypothetical protein KCH_58170 [Kitasatospora cheerisanensis KCTC 2395]|uniref:Uncharacterized protein n=1 Tax=Kitasatospora cheerisanensis KCTC 2395 TaxID=1348663 RepID=A0A066YWL3_9ACTN|nr:hypothetical protein KCH_58170 [Kitasatospora cheerisanensis KCTC 2395]